MATAVALVGDNFIELPKLVWLPASIICESPWGLGCWLRRIEDNSLLGILVGILFFVQIQSNRKFIWLVCFAASTPLILQSNIFLEIILTGSIDSLFWLLFVPNLYLSLAIKGVFFAVPLFVGYALASLAAPLLAQLRNFTATRLTMEWVRINGPWYKTAERTRVGEVGDDERDREPDSEGGDP